MRKSEDIKWQKIVICWEKIVHEKVLIFCDKSKMLKFIIFWDVGWYISTGLVHVLFCVLIYSREQCVTVGVGWTVA